MTDTIVKEMYGWKEDLPLWLYATPERAAEEKPDDAHTLYRYQVDFTNGVILSREELHDHPPS